MIRDLPRGPPGGNSVVVVPAIVPPPVVIVFVWLNCHLIFGVNSHFDFFLLLLKFTV